MELPYRLHVNPSFKWYRNGPGPVHSPINMRSEKGPAESGQQSTKDPFSGSVLAGHQSCPSKACQSSIDRLK